MNKNIIRNFSVYAQEYLSKYITGLYHEGYFNGELKADISVDKVAYKWFIRLVTTYFLAVNKYSAQAEILFKRALEGDISDLKFEEAFIDLCYSCNTILPEMSYDISSEEALLFPFSVSDKEGVLFKLLNDVPKAYFDVKSQKGQVEVIGWMHQYFNSKKNNEVIDVIKKNKIKKEDIPYATQLFTDDWVVKYMVDNSLGLYFLERNNSQKIKENLKYLMPKEITQIKEDLDIKKIKVLDNAMGSGNILTYSFDVLMMMYLELGYSEKAAAVSIIENNLYGIDIDENSYQIAYFCLMMKAREFNEDIFNIELKNNIKVFIEPEDFNTYDLKTFGSEYNREKKALALSEVKYLIETYKNSKEIGSLLQVRPVNYDLTYKYIVDSDISDVHTYVLLLELLSINTMLCDTYEVVVTNPPYLNKFSEDLKTYLNDYYFDYRKDLFSAFMYKNLQLTKENGYSAFMTPFVWMFINSYTKLRKYIIENKQISSLIQLEYSAFREATVPICMFVIKNSNQDSLGQYIKLSNFFGGMKLQEEKVITALNNQSVDYFYLSNQKEFRKIPNWPIAYWSSQNVIRAFEEGVRLDEILEARQGMATGNNKDFLRFWWQVDFSDIVFDLDSFNTYQSNFSGKYVPYNKGGQRRQWYGNYDYVLKFDKDSYNKLAKSGNHLPSRQYYFREAITWGLITSGSFSIRFRECGSVHDVSGMSAFSDDPKMLKYILALLSSPIADVIFKKLNPTLNLQVGDFKNFPVLIKGDIEAVLATANKNIDISKQDWDLWETSWNFKTHPLTKPNYTRVEAAYIDFKKDVNLNFKKLKDNQEKLNKYFINLYNLQSQVSPFISDKDVTLTKILDSESDLSQDLKGNWYIKYKKDIIQSLISYAVGIMFKRYSLSKPGLQKMQSKNGIKISLSKDDIVERFKSFLCEVYGKESLEENLDFITTALGYSKDDLHMYFKEEFYDYHYKTYRKKPIYTLSKDCLEYKIQD